MAPEQVWRNPVDTFSAFLAIVAKCRVVINGGVRLGPLATANNLPDGTAVDIVVRHAGLRLRRGLPGED